MKIKIREKNTAYAELRINTENDHYFVLLCDDGRIAFCNGRNDEETRGIFDGRSWEIYPTPTEAKQILEIFV